MSSISGKIVVVQLSPPYPRTSNIYSIAGGIGGVVVAIVVVVIIVLFIREDSSSTNLSIIASDK